MTAAHAVTTEELRENIAYHTPVVRLGTARTPLDGAVARLLVRVVVDTNLHLPDMFELTFLDQLGTAVADAGITLGMELEVRAPGGRQSDLGLVVGEVTALEGRYGETTWLTVVRGYSHDHRLQRARRARTFVDVTDSDVARQVAGDAGLRIGQVDATTLRHPQLAQADQTDWAFLSLRAAEIGYEVGAAEGSFYFRKAHTVSAGTALPAAMGENLLTFHPRVNVANLVPEVEARAQDPVEARAVSVTAAVASTSADIGAGAPGAAAAQFAPTRPAPPPPTAENGPAASIKGFVAGRGFSVTAGSDQALKDAATALAAHVGSSFAEAEGELLGDARLVAGAVLQVTGVPSQFRGKWLVTGARHVFDNNDRGYRVRATVSGRHDRSLLALMSHGPARSAAAGVGGVVCGVVTDVKDPLNLARVRVMLPWLSPDYVTGWAPVSQLFAGSAGGALFLPQPKDQVLVAFEHGDLRRPYVLGSVINNRTGAGVHLDGSTGAARPGASAVGSGQPAPVVRRGIVSPTGSRVVFHDEAPPSGGRPTAAQVVMATAEDKVAVTLDAVAGSLTLTCTPGSPPGTLTIECDGDVQIKAGASGSLTVDGGKQLTLKAQLVNIEGTGAVAVKGKPVQLN